MMKYLALILVFAMFAQLPISASAQRGGRGGSRGGGGRQAARPAARPAPRPASGGRGNGGGGFNLNRDVQRPAQQPARPGRGAQPSRPANGNGINNGGNRNNINGGNRNNNNGGNRNINNGGDRNINNGGNRNINNGNINRTVINNPVYANNGAWGWNRGVAWAPAPYYWGGGFWGAMAIGVTSAAVYGSIVANNHTYTSYEVQSSSPGATMLSNYQLTQTQCGPANLVVVYGPDKSVICALPNNLVSAGTYNLDTSTLSLSNA